MKIVLKLLLILVVAVFLVASLVGLPGKSSEQLCTGFELNVQDSLQLGMINKEEVEELLQTQELTFENKKTSEINLGNLETTLSSSPYVDTVYASFTASGKLVLTVVPRMPSLHIIPQNGNDYYLDRNGESMPAGRINANLVIVTGNFDQAFAREKLAPLGRCLQDDEFWRIQVQQIDIRNSRNDIRMYTRISDHYVQLGNLDSIPDKLHRLRIFYQQGLPEIGWNKYESLNVAYSGRVIATKKNKTHK